MRPAAAATLTQRRLPVGDGHGGFAASRREAEHPGGMADLGQAIENPCALCLEAAVVEDGVGFGERRVAEDVGVGGEAGERRRAGVAHRGRGRAPARSWLASGARASSASAVSRSAGT